MKIKKTFISILCVTLLTLSTFLGCGAKTKSIVSIEKTFTSGKVDTYTITYSDGSLYNFEITNGTDGKDIDIYELYDAYLSFYPDANFEQFLKTLVDSEDIIDLSVSNKALTQSLKVYSEFVENYYIGWPYQQVAKNRAIYCGSAVIYKIYDDYTYMITNYHVLYDVNAANTSKIADKIVCYLYGSESAPVATTQTDESGTIYSYGDYGIDCEYVGGAITCDLAAIRAKTQDVFNINPNVTEITFADSYTVGETAIAIGNSENEGISVTKGIVSVDNEYINYAIDNNIRSYRSMRIDTAIYGGNSGGGLFNKKGELIGITNAGDGTDQNINYAIPLNIVRPVIENIMFNKTLKTLALGVEVYGENSKYIYDENLGFGKIYEDVMIKSVTENSVAESLNLKAGDKLLSITINSTTYPLTRYFDLSDILYLVKPGDTISFEYQNERTNKTANYLVLASDFVAVS